MIKSMLEWSRDAKGGFRSNLFGLWDSEGSSGVLPGRWSLRQKLECAGGLQGPEVHYPTAQKREVQVITVWAEALLRPSTQAVGQTL